MPEHVLIVGGGLELIPLFRLIDPAVRTTVLCRMSLAPKVLKTGAHARVLAVGHAAPAAEWIAIARAVNASDPFTRLASLAERDQDKAAAIGEALGLEMHSQATTRLVQHKPDMRACLAEAGIDDTPYAVVRDACELRSFLAAHGGPCIVKPAAGYASIGIRRIDGEQDVELALAAAGRDDEWAHGGVLAERLHEGPQYSVEAFSEGGEHEIVGVTAKYSDPVTFIELGHVVPAPVSTRRRAAMAGYVTGVLDALRIRFGPTHTEIVWTAGGPRLIETHIRLGGDEIPQLVQAALGVDLLGHTVRQVLGHRVLPEIRACLRAAAGRRSEAVWFASLPVRGTLEAVEGLDEARAMSGVTEVRTLADPGAELTGLDSSRSRLALARASADDADAAVRLARAAVARLRFRLVTTVADQATI